MKQEKRKAETRPAPFAAPPDETLRSDMEALAARDEDIARAYAACGLPPQRGQEPGFAGLIRIMMGQQVSVQSARAIIGRLETAVCPLTPAGFLELDEAVSRAIGLSRQKLLYGRILAEEITSGRFDLDGLGPLADEAAIEELVRIKGIGRWTAEIYLLFALRRPDIWPVDDLAVVVAMQRLKGLDARPGRAEMRRYGEAWRPYRSAAARFLWHFYRHEGVALDGG